VTLGAEEAPNVDLSYVVFALPFIVVSIGASIGFARILRSRD